MTTRNREMENDLNKQDREIQALLTDVPMPEATAGYFDQALARAMHQGSRRQRKHWITTGFASATALGLVLWFLGGTLMTAPGLPDESSALLEITMAVEVPRTLNLVFTSAEQLDTATLTVRLPEGIEMSGFPGQREITWQTSLNVGNNLLPLKLIATSPLGGEVYAILGHDGRSRAFRVRLNIS